MAALAAVAVYALTSANAARAGWEEMAKLVASDGGSGDLFGFSVAISGDYAIVGAADDNAYAGSAYIFERTGTSWTQRAKLTASDAEEYDALGKSVSISGDCAVVGAEHDDDDGVSSGSVYLFVKPPGGWADATETAKLTASDATAEDDFGHAVSIDGDYVLVGAVGDDDQGGMSGSAYIFRKPPGGWVTTNLQTAKLTVSTGASGDIFGDSVSISGDYAIVGAPLRLSAMGAAYVFVKPVGGWVTTTQEDALLAASDGASGDTFGTSVSISGDYAIVGAPLDDDNCPPFPDDDCKTGSAYLFEKPAGGWVNANETQKLTAADPEEWDKFGGAVAIDGTYAVVGAMFDDDEGAVYVFERTGTWAQTDKLKASDGAPNDWVGYSVAIDGVYALAGAYGQLIDTGAAYVFERKEAGAEKWAQPPDLTPAGIDVLTSFGIPYEYILADDFPCTTSGPITEIQVWGSWFGDYLPLGDENEVEFVLSIHEDIPALSSFCDGGSNAGAPCMTDDDCPDLGFCVPTDYSRPGPLLWSRTFYPGEFTAEMHQQVALHGWLEPPDYYLGSEHLICWKYTFPIDPLDAFSQEGTVSDPIVYWLNVQAYPLEIGAHFGWKTSASHWNDDAVWGWGEEPYPGPWDELRYPSGHPAEGDSIDLAFAINTEPGAETDWYFDDAGTAGWGQTGTPPHWEHMDAGPLPDCFMQDLDPLNPYYAATDPITYDYSGYRFYAEIWLANNWDDSPEEVTVELRQGGWGNPGVVLASDSVVVTEQLGPATPWVRTKYLFDFGTIDDLVLTDESLVLKIIYHGDGIGNTHIYWDGDDCPSGLHALPPGLPGPHTVVCEAQGGGNPTHPSTYWYDVTPDGGYCDFHVQVFDRDPSSYTGWVAPAGWVTAVHQMGDEWWASWWDPTADCQNAVFGYFRFQFDNDARSTWGDWRVTIGNNPNPELDVTDFSGHHFAEPDGYGSRVHVPMRLDQPCQDCGPGPHWVDGCSAGDDYLPSGARVAIDLNLDCIPDTYVVPSGPVYIRRSDPLDTSVNFPGTGMVDGHLDVIDTEILSMTLTGGGITLSAGAGSGLGGVVGPTHGTIVEQSANSALADSFFDVYFEVDLGGGTYAYNQIPMRVEAEIDCVPPDIEYIHPVGCIALYDSPVPGQGQNVANVVTVEHDTYPEFEWYFDDSGVQGWGQTYTPPYWEWMDAGTLPECIMYDLDPDNPYYASSNAETSNYSGYRFYAEIWMANNWPDGANPVTVELRKGGWGDEGVLLAQPRTVDVTNPPHQLGKVPYLFDFGTIDHLILDNESLVLKIIYGGLPGDTHIFWDGEDCPSALHAVAPVLPGRDTVICEPQGGNNPSHPNTYWYDVTPGDFGRCDFHVRVYDPEPANYSSWVAPAGWVTMLHPIEAEWWASWWDPTEDCRNAIFNPFTFSFDNSNTSAWGDWTTTIGNSSNPHLWSVDFAGHHFGQRDGYGYRVHVPQDCQLSQWQNLTGVWKSDAEWGDFDGDGDLDLVIAGETGVGTLVTETYENQGGTLVLYPNPGLVGVKSESSGNLAWGDYDGDGDLDLAVAGESATGESARIYENDGSGTLTWDLQQVLTGVKLAAVAWGDYDNDGDLDLVVTGHDGTQRVATLYKNEPHGTLTVDAGTSLTGLHGGSADWADWDGDGDLDLLLTGYDGSNRQTIFYKNHPVGTLTNDGSHGLLGVTLSDVAWGDYDNDGDLDVAITGETGVLRIARVYENDGSGNFTQVVHLMSIYRSSWAWGDYDNDGNLDLALCGYDGSGLYTRVYRNTGTGFVHKFSFPGVREGSVSWADVDQDGDLDFFMTGADWSTMYARLYENDGCYQNTRPAPPTRLVSSATPTGCSLTWAGASDGETPALGLYYALRVGTSPGADDVLSGTYGTPLMGNVGQATGRDLDVPAGYYYWSVKSVDTGLTSSSWTSSEALCGSCPAPNPPTRPAGEAGYDKVRYISFVPDNIGRNVAFRVTLATMPPMFEPYQGCQVWVAEPETISESSGDSGSTPPPTFTAARLQTVPHCQDWGSIDVVHVSDDEIVPGATYHVQAIDCGCDIAVEANYSAPLVINTSIWGDITDTFDGTHWTAPEGAVLFSDIAAMVDKFKNLPGAPIKARADIAPDLTDRAVDFVDVPYIVDAFRSLPYPFDGPDSCPISPMGMSSSGQQPAPAPREVVTIRPATIMLQPSASSVDPGDTVNVHVYVTGASDLRAYQLSAFASGENGGRLIIEDLRIETDRPDYAFGAEEVVTAGDVAGSRLGATLIAGSVAIDQPVYLGTLTFRALQDARGTFDIRLRTDDSTFLLDSAMRSVPYESGRPVSITVDVSPRLQPSGKPGQSTDVRRSRR